MAKKTPNQKDVENKNIDVRDIDIDKLIPFKNQPFKPYEDERLEDMKTSIENNGILSPIIARPIGESGEFEILSGHNRVNAAKAIGMTQVPTIVKQNISDDEAMVYVIETNLIQRSFSEMRHSEKAVVLTLQQEKLFSQKKRDDIKNELLALEKSGKPSASDTGTQIGTGVRINEKIGSEYGLARNTVARYLRLAKLSKYLLERVDDDQIPFIAGVELSYLSGKDQGYVNTAIYEYACKVTLKNATDLKELSKKSKLTKQNVIDILNGTYKPKKQSMRVTLKPKLLKNYFTENSSSEFVEKEVINSIEFRKKTLPETISRYISGEEFYNLDIESFVISLIEEHYKEKES